MAEHDSQGGTEIATNLTSSQEDYLEAILALIRQGNVARVRDIAKRLDVGKSAVTAALKALAKRELVNYDPYQFITLTDRGRAAAERIDDRHVTLRRFLQVTLGLGRDRAEANACRIEHHADDVVLDRLKCLGEFMQTVAAEGERLQDAFRRFSSEPVAEPVAEPAADTVEVAAPATLAQLDIGQTAKVVRVRGAAATNRRLADMGVTRNTPVTIIRVAPLGDPIEIRVRGYSLSLRKAEAEGIEVELGE